MQFKSMHVKSTSLVHKRQTVGKTSVGESDWSTNKGKLFRRYYICSVQCSLADTHKGP